MKNNCYLAILYWLIGFGVFTGNCTAQTVLNQSDSVAGKVSFTGVVSLDRLNNIYLTDQKNNLHKYDATGKLLTTFSPPGIGHIALLEAWNPAKILLFYDDQQKIVILDRFLAPVSTTILSNYVDGLVRTATFSSDNKIWAFNESNFSLYKIDVLFPEATRTIPLDLMLPRQQYDIRFLREYQNNVYLLDKLTGIYVFDNLGNYQKRLPFTGLTYVGFRGDELYYLSKNQMRFFNLYTLQERMIPLPDSLSNTTFKQVLVGETNVYLISDTELKIISLK